jgi:hypothetical protein
LNGRELGANYPVPNKKETPVDENYISNLPIYTLDQSKVPPPPQQNTGNDFPYDPETKLNMDPHSRKKRSFRNETLGDGEPSDSPSSGISLGIHQRSRNGGQSAGNMPAQGSTFTVQGVPGWSSSPQGKKFNTDNEFYIKAKPVK